MNTRDPFAASTAHPPAYTIGHESEDDRDNRSHGASMGSQQRDVILVVDDSPEALAFVCKALEDAGITALVAMNGASALSLVERVVPDLILLDALMPGMDGFATCKALKTSAARHVPIVFMTGLSEAEHVVLGLEAGGVDYVTKPIVLETLLARIRVHLLNARRAQSARTALDATGRTLLALRPDGTQLWRTPQAEHMLASVAETYDETALQTHLSVWLKNPVASKQVLDLKTDAGGVRLKRVGALSGQEVLVSVEAIVSSEEIEARRRALLVHRFKLTPREAEVLFWLACGKSNRDIGEILSLSPRTINKHLEHIFVKLGVENRAAATALATQEMS